MTPLNLDIWHAARFTLAAVKHAGRHYKDTAKRPFNVSLVGKAICMQHLRREHADYSASGASIYSVHVSNR